MKTFEFKSKSSDTVHTVSVYGAEDAPTIVCTCRGFDTPNRCWHVKEVAEKFGVSLGAPKPAAAKPKQGSLIDKVFSDELIAPEYHPMLASQMKSNKTISDYMNDEWVLEEKYDGHRMLVYIRTTDGVRTAAAYSREGNFRRLPLHLDTALKSTVADGVFDGELYIPGGTGTDVTNEKLAGSLKLVLFDILVGGGVPCLHLPQFERRMALESAALWDANGHVHISPQHAVSEVTLQRIWDRGGEGVILKNVNAAYEQGKRTRQWVKVKQRLYAEVTLVGFASGELGPYSRVTGRGEDGVEVTVKSLNTKWRNAFAADPDSWLGEKFVIDYTIRTAEGNYQQPHADHFVDRVIE